MTILDVVQKRRWTEDTEFTLLYVCEANILSVFAERNQNFRLKGFFESILSVLTETNIYNKANIPGT